MGLQKNPAVLNIEIAIDKESQNILMDFHCQTELENGSPNHLSTAVSSSLI
jgi:hypothetical protein